MVDEAFLTSLVISYEVVLGKIFKKYLSQSETGSAILNFESLSKETTILEDSGRPSNLTYSSSEEEVDNIATRTVILDI